MTSIIVTRERLPGASQCHEQSDQHRVQAVHSGPGVLHPEGGGVPSHPPQILQEQSGPDEGEFSRSGHDGVNVHLFQYGEYEGCHQDSFNQRLFQGDMVKFKTDNSPEKCIQHCLETGYLFAGLQYGLVSDSAISLVSLKLNLYFRSASVATHFRRTRRRRSPPIPATWSVLETRPSHVEDISLWIYLEPV